MSKRRFVHIYRDPLVPNMRFISDEDHDTESITYPRLDSDLVVETVELLTVKDGKTLMDSQSKRIEELEAENKRIHDEAYESGHAHGLNESAEEMADLLKAVAHLWTCVECGEGPVCDVGKQIQKRWLTQKEDKG